MAEALPGCLPADPKQPAQVSPGRAMLPSCVENDPVDGVLDRLEVVHSGCELALPTTVVVPAEHLGPHADHLRIQSDNKRCHGDNQP